MPRFQAVPRPFLFLLGLLLFAIGAAMAAPQDRPAQKPEKPRPVIGRFEYVVVRDIDMKFKARIDTGAAISSINAKILEIKQTPEGERVVFQIIGPDGASEALEREIIGWNHIKVMGTNIKNRRPVVILRICLGGKKLKGQVNLNDRSAFLYPVLIGRNLLRAGHYLIDPRERYLLDPGCD